MLHSVPDTKPLPKENQIGDWFDSSIFDYFNDDFVVGAVYNTPDCETLYVVVRMSQFLFTVQEIKTRRAAEDVNYLSLASGYNIYGYIHDIDHNITRHQRIANYFPEYFI